MELLGNDMITNILLNLNLRDLGNFYRVNRLIYTIFVNDYHWRRRLEGYEMKFKGYRSKYLKTLSRDLATIIPDFDKKVFQTKIFRDDDIYSIIKAANNTIKHLNLNKIKQLRFQGEGSWVQVLIDGEGNFKIKGELGVDMFEKLYLLNYS